ncbi:hypothetical protein [Bacterioplanoides sp.]|uniref:hypothetical protein n=1 Tax=Bacterioplanoides sp. TaxID=2066072 RepID=UPI003AFFED3A
MLEKRSQQLIALLQSVADNERQTHRLYTDFLSSSHCISQDIFDLCHTALHEDKSHFDEIDACLTRLTEPHHALTPDTAFTSDTALTSETELAPATVFTAPPAYHSHITFTPQHPLTTQNLLQHLCDIEAFSVKAYNEICNIAMEYDYQVFDLSYRNMNENLAHLDFVSHLLSNLNAGAQL